MGDLEFVNRPERFGQRGSVRPHREPILCRFTIGGSWLRTAGPVCAPLGHASGLPPGAVEAENNRLRAKSSDSPGDCRRLRITCLAVYSIMFGALARGSSLG